MVYKKQQLVFGCFRKFQLSSRIQKAVYTLGARDGLRDGNCNAVGTREEWKEHVQLLSYSWFETGIVVRWIVDFSFK